MPVDDGTWIGHELDPLSVRKPAEGVDLVVEIRIGQGLNRKSIL